MAEICHGVTEPSATGASSSRAEADQTHRLKFVPGVCKDNAFKKPRLAISPASFSRKHRVTGDNIVDGGSNPKFGVASVCGRRREMEDTVAVHPSFIQLDDNQLTANTHYFGVFDGHGCSHVAMMCKNRLHVLVKEEEELMKKKDEWKKTMERSFRRMDEEVILLDGCSQCDLHGPQSYGVGSTTVVALVTPHKIVIANCGDSRAVLCRNDELTGSKLPVGEFYFGTEHEFAVFSPCLELLVIVI